MASTLPNYISNDFVTCSLCFSAYKDPRTLPCLHSFCHSCLQDYLTRNTNSSVFACPVCKTRTMSALEGATQFKANHFLSSLKDTFPDVKDLTPWCEFCAGEGKDKSGTSRCLDCRQSLCDTCAAVHCRTKLTQSHLVLTMYQLQSGKYDRDIRIRQPITCEVHPGKKVKLYCTKCEQLLCLTCKATDHDGHKCVDLFDIGSHDREFLRTLMEPVKNKVPTFELQLREVESSETDVMVNREHLMEELHARRDFLCKMIEDRCNVLKAQIDGVFVSHQKQLEGHKESLRLDIQAMKTAADFTDKLVTHGRDAEVVSMKRLVHDRLVWLKSLETPGAQFQDGFKFQMGSISKGELQKVFGNLVRGAFPQPRSVTPLPTISPKPVVDRTPRYEHPRERGNSPIREPAEKPVAYIHADTKPRNMAPVLKSSHTYPEDNITVHPHPFYTRPIKVKRDIRRTPPKVKNATTAREQSAERRLPPVHQQPSHVANAHLSKAQMIRSLPVRTSQDSKKSWPTGIAVNSIGELLVVDSNNKKVKVFSKETFLRAEIGRTGRQKLIDPWSVAVLINDNIVVTDRGSHNIKLFNHKGKFLYSFQGGLADPHGVAVNSKDEIIVADWEKRLVYVFDPQGNLLNSISGVDGSPLFHSPYYVSVTPRDDIVVSDYMGHCIKIFDPQGRALYQYGTRGAAEEQLKYPNGVCADTYGNLIIVDRGNNRIHMISMEGQFRCFLATVQDGVRDPTAVCVDRDGHLAVTDGTGMIKMYRYFPLQ